MKVATFVLVSFFCFLFMLSLSARAHGAEANFLTPDKILNHFTQGEPEKNFRPRADQLQSRAIASLVLIRPESADSSIHTENIRPDVDLRAFDTPIKDQTGPRCTAYSLSAVVENILNQTSRSRNVSVSHLWSEYALADADAAIDAFNHNYITESEIWPDHANAPVGDLNQHLDIHVSQFQNHQYNMQGALEALSQNHPVMMAFQVPADVTNCKATISATSRRTKGQHAVEAVGYHLDSTVAGGGYFILKNSWTADCGDHGYHYYPFALCQRNDLYCYFIEVSAVDVR